MYVMFPAEDIIQISLGFTPDQLVNCNYQPIAAPETYVGANAPPTINHHPPTTERHLFQLKNKTAASKRGATKRSGKNSSANTMAAAPGHQETSVLKEAYHPSLNESLKVQNSVSFKLVKTVSEFTQQLGQIYEQHSVELQTLVSNFRKRNSELRKERPACPSAMFHTWEVLLQEVEIDSQTHSDIASILSRQVSRPLLERTFHRKLQSRKVFANRENYEALLKKTEEKLSKCRQDYKAAYALYASQQSQQNLAAYMDAHNAYVTQLHATNGMLDQYNRDTLPGLLKELEEVYSDLCLTLTESVLQGSEIISARAVEQAKRYDGLGAQCKGVTPEHDLAVFVKSMTIPSQNPHRLYNFAPAQVHHQHSTSDQPVADATSIEPSAPLFKDELLIERPASFPIKTKLDVLKKEALELETEIKQLHDALEGLVRIQQRSVESSLYNKVNEIQEDISMKRFDLKVAQIHLGAIRAQKELFSTKIDSIEGRERKMSSSSTGSMKNKWLKAFKSLKTPQSNGQPSKDQDKKNQMYHAVSTIIAMRKNGGGQLTPGGAGGGLDHNFQEYTYKKITPCDVCSQVLRGHTRQGLKCRHCKLNVHVDCQEEVQGRCQQKSRLLRRQKSTSELDTSRTSASAIAGAGDVQPGVDGEDKTLPAPDIPPGHIHPYPGAEARDVDTTYQVLKQAGEMSSTRKPNTGAGGAGVLEIAGRSVVATTSSTGRNMGPPLHLRPQPPTTGTSSLAVAQVPLASSSGGSLVVQPSDTHRRRHLFSAMKSLSVFGSKHNDSSRSISLPETPHTPRRQKLNLRMKSLSLDSPESSDPHRHQQRVPTAGSHLASVNRLQSPSSPVHNRRLLCARNMRMSSVELPDDNDRSLSSASTSPCPSPKPHRLLPTNLYVVLYNFKSRHQDELDLKAGYKVTVVDTSDADWWKGKCLGRVGFFPSKYVTKLQSGERPLQVTHNLQVSDGDNGLMLLRDQIVIQVGDELDGMVMIRAGDTNKQGVCPLKFLQEM